MVAALFALHPLHVESVAWVSERKDVLSTLFFMLTLWAYARYAARPSWPRYGLVFGFLALGLMAKPMLVTVPFVLLLLDYWPLGRLGEGRSRDRRGRKARLIVEKVPLLVLVAASSVVTFVAQQRGGAMSSIEVVPLGQPYRQRAGQLRGLYGKDALARADLAVFYPYRDTVPAIAMGRGCGAAGRDQRFRDLGRPAVAVPGGGVVVVPGNTGAGHRTGPGG